jgi:hypothetical protein
MSHVTKARVFISYSPRCREAFGLRALERHFPPCQEASPGLKAPINRTHSKRFAPSIASFPFRDGLVWVFSGTSKTLLSAQE